MQQARSLVDLAGKPLIVVTADRETGAAIRDVVASGRTFAPLTGP
jgi:hypothetical protein